MGYFLFLLVNATLFIRPSEILPELAALRIYEALIISCFALSFPAVLEQLQPKNLEANPITLGMLVFCFCCGLSHVMQLDLVMAASSFYKFFKVVIYYLLLVGVVNTPRRIQVFLIALGLFVTIVALIAVLRYHEIITLTPPPTIDVSEQEFAGQDSSKKKDDGTASSVQDAYYDPTTGETVLVNRLRGTGVFNDPNDLCLPMVFGVLFCLYALSEPSFGFIRYLSLAPLGLFLLALNLTYSRGGLLGLLAGLVCLFAGRYGWKRTILLGALCMPPMLVFFGGRMTTISTSEVTAQARFMLWRDGLVLFKESPLFGVGMEKYADYAVQVAHNSFIHAFAELGVLGGMLFLGMFYYALWALAQVQQTRILDESLRRMLPFLMAMVAGLAVGILTLSRTYEVPTYTLLGLVTAYLRIVPVQPPLTNLGISRMLLLTIGGLSLVFLAAMSMVVRTLTN